MRTATLSFANNDADQNPYYFSIQGQGSEFLIAWDFVGAPGDQDSSNSASVSNSFQSGAITRGPGLVAAANADSFNSADWDTSGSFDTANANGDYLTFMLSPKPGVTYAITQIAIAWNIPTSGSPDKFALRSSLDGFVSNLITFDFSSSIIFPKPFVTVGTTNLGSVAALQLQNLSTSVTFRLIGASATSTASSFRLETAGNDLEIRGNTVTVLPAGFGAAHAVVNTGYMAGATATITNTINYSGTLSTLAWQVQLPTGWSFASSTGTAGAAEPAVGATGFLDWTWSTPPASGATFSYTLNVPVGTTGAQTIAALMQPTQSGTQYSLFVKPDPLVIAKRVFHSADTGSSGAPDGKISLVELLRVIELYNTRNGTERTGAYAVDPTNTEDGFAADPAPSSTATVTLARYHSADTVGATVGSRADGKISLTELLRVIELYDFRAGTMRTGQYHAQAGTEDGFAPGP